jgi:hypothetical protein
LAELAIVYFGQCQIYSGEKGEHAMSVSDLMRTSHHRKEQRHLVSKVEFSNLNYFIEDIKSHGVTTVRLDTSQRARQSELSFVQYVDLTLFVTAVDKRNCVMFEYSEAVGTAVSIEANDVEEPLLEKARQRLDEIGMTLRMNDFKVEHGRVMDVVIL